MVKAIWMPDLHQFKPGFFDLSARCGGSEFEHLIIVRYASFPHGCLRLWQSSVADLLTFSVSRCHMRYERSAAREHGQVSLRYGEGHWIDRRGRGSGQWTDQLVGCIIGAIHNERVVLYCLLAGREMTQ